MSLNNFYVYLYLRANDSETAKKGTPYYVGKGTGRRAFVKHSCPVPKDINNIIFVKENLSESEAHLLEIQLISDYGRKDIQTGILHNKTNGGEGLSNPSELTKAKLAAAKRNESAETKEKRSLAAKKRVRTPHSDSTKQKISQSNLGKKRSDQSKKLMSDKATGRLSPRKGVKLSIELIEKLKIANAINGAKKKGIMKPKVQCPHCEKVGGKPAMTRFHFENCKRKNY